MPPEAWWLPALTLLVLGAAAAVDAFTAVIPDALIFLGTVATVAVQGFYVSWPFASHHLAVALAVMAGLWAINELWHWRFRQDALGMGDAKWTMLAVACFGTLPPLFAWGFGSCLAVLWIGGLRLARRDIAHVYFAPFLFAGLLAGLYWLRLKS